MKKYVGKHEEMTAERWQELGWDDEAIKGLMKESQTEPRVYVEEEGAEPSLLEATEEATQHSPDGFSWGYSGSGPTALAHSILTDHLGKLPPSNLTVSFRDKFLSPLDQEGEFEITEAEIKAFREGKGVAEDAGAGDTDARDRTDDQGEPDEGGDTA